MVCHLLPFARVGQGCISHLSPPGTVRAPPPLPVTHDQDPFVLLTAIPASFAPHPEHVTLLSLLHLIPRTDLVRGRVVGVIVALLAEFVEFTLISVALYMESRIKVMV